MANDQQEARPNLRRRDGAMARVFGPIAVAGIVGFILTAQAATAEETWVGRYLGAKKISDSDGQPVPQVDPIRAGSDGTDDGISAGSDDTRPTETPEPVTNPSGDSDTGTAPQPAAGASTQSGSGKGGGGTQANSCVAMVQPANNCCDDPLGCLANGGKETTGLGATASTVVGMGSALASAAGGVKQMCQMMKTLGLAGMVANAGFGVMCYRKRSQCIDQCNKEIAALEAQKQPPDPKLKSALSSCKGLTAKVEAYGLQGVQSGFATLMAQQCEDATENKTPMQASSIPSMCDDPLYKDTDACKAPSSPVNCNDPAQASNPICLASQSPTSSNYVNDSTPGPSARNGLSGDDLSSALNDPNEQGIPLGEKLKPNQNSALAGGMGGGAGGMGSGSGGTGAYEDPTAGGGAPAPVQPQGVLGGNWPGGGSYGRGSGGAAGANAEAQKRGADGKPIGLGKYLPGEGAQWRGLAGVGSEVGRATSNIWAQVSTRFRALCSKDRLYDCNLLTGVRGF